MGEFARQAGDAAPEAAVRAFAMLLPAPLAALSGGPAYARALVGRLRGDGHAVSVVELAGRHPLPDDAARAAAAAAWRGCAADMQPIIDGMGLPAFEPLADSLRSRGAAALVHHPTALEAGADATVREALRAIERRMLPTLRRVIVTSDDTAARLAAEFGVPPERIRVVTPGTDPAPRSEGPRQPGCAVLSVGTLLPRKGHDVLLRALARLPDLDWMLTVAGDAPDARYAQTLQALAADLGIAARVRFAGGLQGAALEAEWQRAGLFALATHHEGYGMAIAEALRRGLPVAVTSGGAAAALVPAAAGVVAAPGDVVALSNGMRRVVFDAALRQRMAQAAWLAGGRLPDWAEQARRFVAALE